MAKSKPAKLTPRQLAAYYGNLAAGWMMKDSEQNGLNRKSSDFAYLNARTAYSIVLDMTYGKNQRPF